MKLEEVFTFKQVKDGKAIIFYHNKQVLISKGSKAQNILEKIQQGTSEEKQLILAKSTGSFKHGNEGLVTKQK